MELRVIIMNNQKKYSVRHQQFALFDKVKLWTSSTVKKFPVLCLPSYFLAISVWQLGLLLISITTFASLWLAALWQTKWNYSLTYVIYLWSMMRNSICDRRQNISPGSILLAIKLVRNLITYFGEKNDNGISFIPEEIWSFGESPLLTS